MRYTSDNCNCDIEYTNEGSVVLSGVVNGVQSDSYIIFWAANPPDYHTGFTGSGLPYPNYEIAYENTPNKGTLKLNNDGTFKFSIRYPSAYYAGLGSYYVKPHINIQINSQNSIGKTHVIPLGEGIPFRTLTYPPVPETAPRTSPMFYSGREKLPLRTQEQVLRDSAYPDKLETPSNFWGLRPSEP